MSNADTHRELHDLFNGRDFDALAKRYRDDAVYVDRARGITTTGGDEFKAYLQGWVDTMSNARVTEARYVDAGGTSIALFVGRGTNDGPIGPFAASGKDISFPLCEVMTYDDEGWVTGGEMYYDQLAILTQAGHLPAP
jgi:hypothetical protein